MCFESTSEEAGSEQRGRGEDNRGSTPMDANDIYPNGWVIDYNDAEGVTQIMPPFYLWLPVCSSF